CGEGGDELVGGDEPAGAGRVAGLVVSEDPDGGVAGLSELGTGADGGFGKRPVGGPSVGAAVGVERPVALAAPDGGFGGGDMAIVGGDVKVLGRVVDGGEELPGGCDAVADGVDPGCAGQQVSPGSGDGSGRVGAGLLV